MKSENKLQGKDLINIGIFTAIYLVIVVAVAMLGFIPIFLPLLSVIAPVLGGIPCMLFLTKVKKPGMILIMSIIMGIMMILTGMGYYALLVGIVSGTIAELIYRSGKYASAAKAVLSYGVFSIWIWGNYFLFYFNQEKFFAAKESFGQDYKDTILKIMPSWLFPVLLVCTFVFGIIGGLLGKSMLKKHFVKAGIV